MRRPNNAKEESPTVCLNRDVRRALSRKAEGTERSISRVVYEVVRPALAEDAEDLEAIKSRAHEPNLDFDNVVRSLKRCGKIKDSNQVSCS